MASFRDRLHEFRPILLDGATGTELNRRRVDTRLPLWSAAALIHAADDVLRIHADYAAAGAELITANTFRTHERSLREGGVDAPRNAAASLTAKAVELARSAAGAAAWVAGSQAPLEDCYSPQLTPSDDALEREHAQMAENLSNSGVDVILVETQPTIREAAIATRCASATGLPVLVSFVCSKEGRLLSGESLRDAVGAILEFQPDAVLVNCAPASAMAGMLEEITFLLDETAFGCYANIGEADPVQGWKNTGAEDPAVYAQCARTWRSAGARLIGGCCGTTPDHIAALRKMLDDE